MGFIGNLFSSGKGSGWEAGAAQLDLPTSVAQAQTANDQTQQGLAQQLAFLQALRGQGGIANQSSVFNQLQNVANGTGPNPAQAMLNNATGQNIANQAALMAGQRGASANAGLIARQAAQQGANLQQNAAGQAASLQANQGLNALNQLGGIAGQQVGQEAQATAGLNQFAQGNQQNILGAINAQNQAKVSNMAQQNQAQSAVASQNAGSQNKMGAGLLGGIGSFLGLAQGGEVPKVGGPRSKYALHMSSGGQVPAMVSPGEKYLSPEEAKAVAQGASVEQMGKTIPGRAPVKGDNPKNDIVPAKLEAGGMVIPKSVMESDDPVKHAISFVRAHMSKQSKLKGKK